MHSIIPATDSLPIHVPVIPNSIAPHLPKSHLLSNTPRLFYGTIASASCSSRYTWYAVLLPTYVNSEPASTILFVHYKRGSLFPFTINRDKTCSSSFAAESWRYMYIYKVPNQLIDRSIACFLVFCCCPEYVPTCTFLSRSKTSGDCCCCRCLVPPHEETESRKRVCVYFEKLLNRLLTWSVILKETRAVQLCLRVSYRNMRGRKFFPLLHGGCVAGSISSCSCCLVPATCT